MAISSTAWRLSGANSTPLPPRKKQRYTPYFPKGNAARAIELVADLAINSQFPANELDKEREVVIDEINSYRDTPSEAVYDDFEDMDVRKHSAGHNILWFGRFGSRSRQR